MSTIIPDVDAMDISIDKAAIRAARRRELVAAFMRRPDFETTDAALEVPTDAGEAALVTRHTIRQALAQMDEPRRSAVIAYLQQGFSRREVAALLGIARSTVTHALQDFDALVGPDGETVAQQRERQRQEDRARRREAERLAAYEEEERKADAATAAWRAMVATAPPEVLRAALRPGDSLSALMPFEIRVRVALWRRAKGQL